MGTLAADNVLNSTEVYLNDAGNPLPLEPFFTIGSGELGFYFEPATAFGDDDQNEWRVHVRPSEDAPTPNGRPVLALSQFDALTTVSYRVAVEELEAPVELIQDFGTLVNWVTVQYQNELGRAVFITPDNSPTLKDDTSIAAWGEFHLERPLNIGAAADVTATELGARYLAAHKDPKFIVSGPLRVKGFIRGANNEPIPVSRIKAGGNIQIEDFLDDIAQVSGAGMTFRISRVAYNDATETAEIYTGLVPDAIEILLAQMNAGLTVIGRSGAIGDPADLY
ncbi:MAG: hypothetical protein HC804_14610 [Anaerolineae bacterium]|nr:hypothetical protein [Anaerolineae bacterium]